MFSETEFRETARRMGVGDVDIDRFLQSVRPINWGAPDPFRATASDLGISNSDIDNFLKIAPIQSQVQRTPVYKEVPNEDEVPTSYSAPATTIIPASSRGHAPAGIVMPPINPQVAPTTTSTGDYVALIKKYFPPEQWENAYAVMIGESGGRPGAIGDDYVINGVYAPSYGLFQIRGLPGRPGKEQLLNPEFNVQYAANMWRQQGWGPWSAATKLGIR